MEPFRAKKDIKEAIRAKKDALKASLQNRSSSDLQFRYSEARKAAAQAGIYISLSSESKNVQRTLLGEIWSSAGFQLLIGKQSILANHSQIEWEKFTLPRPPSRILLGTSFGMRRKSFHVGKNILKICGTQ